MILFSSSSLIDFFRKFAHYFIDKKLMNKSYKLNYTLLISTGLPKAFYYVSAFSFNHLKGCLKLIQYQICIAIIFLVKEY